MHNRDLQYRKVKKMDRIKLYKEMNEVLKNTLKEVCEKHDCMEKYDGCMMVLEDMIEDAKKN